MPLLGYCRVLLTSCSSSVWWPGKSPSWSVDQSLLVGHRWPFSSGIGFPSLSYTGLSGFPNFPGSSLVIVYNPVDFLGESPLLFCCQHVHGCIPFCQPLCSSSLSCYCANIFHRPWLFLLVYNQLISAFSPLLTLIFLRVSTETHPLRCCFSGSRTFLPVDTNDSLTTCHFSLIVFSSSSSSRTCSLFKSTLSNSCYERYSGVVLRQLAFVSCPFPLQLEFLLGNKAMVVWSNICCTPQGDFLERSSKPPTYAYNAHLVLC